MTIEIQFVDSCRDIEQSLWQTCFPAQFESYFWYHTLETCGITDQFTFSYALIKKQGKIVGIAPCFLHDLPMSLVAPEMVSNFLNLCAKVVPQAAYQRTLFIGSPCAEEGTIGLVPGVELAEVIVPLARAMVARSRKQKAVMVAFKDCPPETRAVMSQLIASQKFFHVHSYPGTMMKLVGTTVADYFANLSRSRRHNFKKKLRRSREELELTTTIVKRPSDEEVNELFGLFMQTYEKGKTKFEKLNVQFFLQIREAEQSWFILQRDKDGKMVTFMLLFKLGNRMVNKFIGLDYRRGPTSFLYFRQFEAALEFAYQQKVPEFQSGQTGYRAKLDLGHDLVPLHNYCHHNNFILNAVYAKLSEDITWTSLDPDLVTYLNAHQDKAAALAE